MKLNRTGSNWNELERSKINENWDIIEGGYNDVVGQITDEVVGHLIDSAKLIWKEPVDTYGDLPTNAEVGETRMVRKADPEGISYVYRFDGEKWEKIQEIDVTLVNEVDRRLTAQLADVAIFTIEKEDDFSTLQTAIDNLSFGDTLILQRGRIYNLSQPLTISHKKNIKIIFNGSKFLFDYQPSSQSDGLLNVFESENIVLEDVYIDGLLNTAIGIKVDNTNGIKVSGEVVNCKYNGVTLSGCSNVVMSNLALDKNGGVYLGGSLHITLSVNVLLEWVEVKDATGKGISFTETRDIDLYKCIILNTLDNSGDGIYVSTNSENVSIRKCSVIDPQGNAVKISRNAHNIVFDECTISKTRGEGYGTMCQGGKHVTFKNTRYNTVGQISVVITEHPSVNESTEYITFQKCVFTSGGEKAIQASKGFSDYSDLYVKDVTVEDCLFNNISTAIDIRSVDDATIEGNIINSPTASPIILTGSKENKQANPVIKNNKIIDLPSGTLAISGTRLKDAKFIENYIEGVGESNGIQLGGCENTLIFGNYMIGMLLAIRLTSTSTQATIISNSIYNSVNALRFEGSNGLVASNDFLTSQSEVPYFGENVQYLNNTNIKNVLLNQTSFIIESGTAGGRPKNPTVGQMYFDTSSTIGKPIWYDGDSWIDANGETVPG